MPTSRFPLTAARYAPPQQHLPGTTCLLTLPLADILTADDVAPLRRELLAEERVCPAGPPGAAARHTARKRYFAAWDARLDAACHAPGAHTRNLLRSSTVARAVRAELHRAAEAQHFGLLAYCVLPNHLHLLLRLPPAAEAVVSLKTALHRFKTRSAQQANTLLGRNGAFWETASHELRLPDETDTNELQRVVAYLRRQPVALGLASATAPEQWPHLYVAADFWWS